jgi:hypothetical protein
MEPLADRLPLVIGVTGHRDLREEDVPRLEAEVAAIIARLRHEYLGSGAETPIIVLSSLAEGADRLAARVALAHGARLVAPMPMPIEEYRRDFEPGLKEGNAAEFDALLAQAMATPIAPFTPGNSIEAVRTDPEKRNEQYRAVGILIAQHCHILIALWDGDGSNPSVGGTAEVVAFKRDGIPLAVSGSARAGLDSSELGPVIHVVTPRQKETSGAGEVSVAPWGKAVIKRHRGGVIRRLLHAIGEFFARVSAREIDDVRKRLSHADRRELEAWETFETQIGLSRTFNHEARVLEAAPDGRSRIARNRDHLFDGCKDDAERQAAAGRVARWCRFYALADTLAQERQAQFKQDWLLLFTFAFAAFLCFATYSHSSLGVWPLAGYSVCYLVVFVLFVRARFGHHQERFLDYRAFAEALRVAVYWKLVGVGSGDVMASGGTAGVLAGAYPIKQPNELSWVKISLRTLDMLDRRSTQDAPESFDAVAHSVARRCWVEGQSAFFGRRGVFHNQRAEFFKTWAVILLVVTPFLFVPSLIATIFSTRWSGLKEAVLLAIGLIPGLAAALAGYCERLAYSAQARQYDRMRMLFERALELLPETVDAANVPLARSVYAELGAEAMNENAEWVAIYRERPIEPLH